MMLQKLISEKIWFEKERNERSLLNVFYYAEPTAAKSSRSATSTIQIEIQSAEAEIKHEMKPDKMEAYKLLKEAGDILCSE